MKTFKELRKEITEASNVSVIGSSVDTPARMKLSQRRSAKMALPKARNSQLRLSGPTSSVAGKSSALRSAQTVARGVAPVASMVSGSSEFKSGTNVPGNAKLSDRFSSLRKSVEKGAATGVGYGALTGKPKNAMASGILGGISGGVSNAFGQLAQQKAEKNLKSVNRAVTPAELEKRKQEKSQLNKNTSFDKKLDTSGDKLNAALGRPEQKQQQTSEIRNIGKNSVPSSGSASKERMQTKPQPAVKKTIPSGQPKQKTSSSSNDAFMADLRASAAKMKDATASAAKETGKMKSAAGKFSGSFSGSGPQL